MQYKIISASVVFSLSSSLEKLAKDVNESITLGWEPQGGLTAYGNSICQAMVKRR